ncbi:CAP domain-containing protein [Candidatus Oleimmundimicrobium sp.]|uniref:CAP domain-containing protein n=1 Tax=Candidatus Oleimmundimicrobium sp. TaxID=3060597 RepID=UPI00271AF236|nr:CAP domain-containing protein [Candidatus Oleimmundimicrobium sp.]MDO8886370.1 hypothetical protein [Candidatus Oleimmundimicrobium sp.]
MSADNQQKKEKTKSPGGNKKRALTLFIIVILAVILVFGFKTRFFENPNIKKYFGLLVGEDFVDVSDDKKPSEKEETKKIIVNTEDDWWKEARDRPAEPEDESEKEIFVPITPPALGEERSDTKLLPAEFKIDLLKLINDFRRYEGIDEVSIDSNLCAQARQKSNEAVLRGMIRDNYIKETGRITYLGIAGEGVESMVVQENLNDTAYETYMNSRWKRIGIGASLGSFDGNEQVVWAIILAE